MMRIKRAIELIVLQKVISLIDSFLLMYHFFETQISEGLTDDLTGLNPCVSTEAEPIGESSSLSCEDPVV